MQRASYPVVNRGTARIGATEISLWGGFEKAVGVGESADEGAYSDSTTRSKCACEILNGATLGQGCSIPAEGFPGGVAPGGNDGPSTLAVIGGVTGAGLILALATGIL